jgi:hypothetical protein
MRRVSIVSIRAAVACLIFALALGAITAWRASRALHSAAQEVHSEHEIRFAVRPLAPSLNTDFEPISSLATFLQAAAFQGRLYVAGPGGLFEYELGGAPLRQYVVGRDLPGSPLVALAPAILAASHQPELILATAHDGLLAFNGRGFRQIFPYDPDARAITAILPDASGHLLIGTKKRGVLVYDGRQITVLHPTLKDIYVTALAGSESDLWIGTLSGGVLHFHAGQTDSFGEAQGLPDPQVTSLALAGEATYVGTPLGVAVFSRGRFSRVLATGVLATALLATDDQLYVGSEDQGVIPVQIEGRRPNPNNASIAFLRTRRPARSTSPPPTDWFASTMQALSSNC